MNEVKAIRGFWLLHEMVPCLLLYARDKKKYILLVKNFIHLQENYFSQVDERGTLVP
jgi:hypothetical protein